MINELKNKERERERERDTNVVILTPWLANHVFFFFDPSMTFLCYVSTSQRAVLRAVDATRGRARGARPHEFNVHKRGGEKGLRALRDSD